MTTSAHPRLPKMIDARAGWILPIAILVVAIYFTTVDETFEARVSWTALAASVACMLCMAAVGYRLISMVTMTAAVHMITYPIAAVLNALLETPAVRPDLWSTTDLAMIGCAVGCASLAGGAVLMQRGRSEKRFLEISPGTGMVSVSANLVLWSLLIPSILIRVMIGGYEDRFAEDSLTLIEQTGHFQNILSYVTRVSQIGMYLQLFRYMQSRCQKDLLIFFAMTTSFMLAFLPTGSRTAAFGFVPWMFLFYVAVERNRWKALILLVTLVISFSFLSIIVELYRTSDQRYASVGERFSKIGQIAADDVSAEEATRLRILASRLADYVSAGRIINYSPQIIPFRGIEHLDELWAMFVPKLIFPERPTLGLSEVISIEAYGVHKGSEGGGSSPTMVIGDLYSRWGWTGIVIGMAILGAILSGLDRLCLRKLDVQSVILYALYVQTIPAFTFSLASGIIVVLTRELLVCWIISKILTVLVMRTSSTPITSTDTWQKMAGGPAVS